MTNRELCIPWLGYDGGAVLVQGAIGEQATDSYKVPFLLLTVIDQAMVAFTYNMQVELLKQEMVFRFLKCRVCLDLLDTW